MRTNRTTLAAVLSIALAVVPAAVAAQSADEELATPSAWTGTQIEGDPFPVDGPVDVIPGGFRTSVGMTFRAEATDPRATGDVWVALVYDYTPTGMSRGIGPMRMVNEGGSWEGTAEVVGYPDGSEFRMALMDGQGGYEGLTMTMTNYISSPEEEHVQGLIWKGEVPQLSAADALPE